MHRHLFASLGMLLASPAWAQDEPPAALMEQLEQGALPSPTPVLTASVEADGTGRLRAAKFPAWLADTPFLKSPPDDAIELTFAWNLARGRPSAAQARSVLAETFGVEFLVLASSAGAELTFSGMDRSGNPVVRDISGSDGERIFFETLGYNAWVLRSEGDWHLLWTREASLEKGRRALLRQEKPGLAVENPARNRIAALLECTSARGHLALFKTLLKRKNVPETAPRTAWVDESSRQSP